MVHIGLTVKLVILLLLIITMTSCLVGWINSIKKETTVGITGASGALGKELTKLFRQKGFKVIGFTHSKTNSEINLESPNEWIKWECGQESTIKKHLKKIDILILNHGIYNLSRENSNYEFK